MNTLCFSFYYKQQPSAVAILDSRSDASAHAIKLLTENREKRKLDSNIIEMEEIKEIEASTESSTSVSSLEIQEKKANNSKTIKVKRSSILLSRVLTSYFIVNYY